MRWSAPLLHRIGLGLFLVAVLIPPFLLFKYSISDKESVVTGGEYPQPFWPFHPTLQLFEQLFTRDDFLGAFSLSLQIAVLTVLFSLVLGAPAAFALARYRFPGKALVLFLMISVRLLPDITSVVPVVEQFARYPFSLVPELLQVALAHTLLSLPYVLYIAIGVFETIPRDLEEQAQLLGASRLFAFRHIVLPVALPGLAAAAIYAFLLSWNEFVFTFFLTFQSTSTTLPVLLQRIMAWTVQTNYLAAIALALTLPVIVFTMIVQKYMRAGMMAGAIK